MALQVIVKNSSVSGNEPTAGQLANGELALNYHANGPFITCKDTAGVVRRVAGVWVNATAPSSPMPGEFWLDISVSPPQLKVYKDGGDAWVPAITVYAATTSVAGVIELATNAETQTGTETNRAVTPASLQSKLTAITGDVTFNASDVSTIAELAVSKLADGSARQLLQTDAAGTGVEWASNIDIPGTLDVTSAATFDGAVTIAGNLTVNGTTTNINTVNLTVEDKNIIIADVATPTDVTADGGGITLKGTTDKTINWIDATDAWTLSEHVNIASAKEYRVAGTKVLDATSLGNAVVSSSLTSVGTIGTGVWNGSTIGKDYGGTGQTSYTDGQLLIGNSTGNTLTKSTLTAGSNITITNGNGSITIASSNPGGTVTNVSGTAPISVANGTTTPAISIAAATTSVVGAVQLSDSTSTTSSVLAATPTAVKAAYDLANAALPKAGGTVTGNLEIGTAGSLSFEGATTDGFETTIAVVDPTADRTITLPNTTGTVVTTGDTGTVTSTMLLDGTILNEDINASAAIVDTKLATIATAGKVSNSATTATDANTASAIVTRDASGNFTAGTITAALTGAASSNVLKAGDTMTGVLAVTAGTAALPAITPSGDPNTGIFSPGADQLAISTNGTERLRLSSTGELMFKGAGTTPGTDKAVSFSGSAPINSMVLDSSGRLGVGSSSPQCQLTNTGNSSFGTNSWPTTDVGNSAGRVLIGNEGQLMLWNETVGAGNTAVIMLGAKTGAGANTLGYSAVRGGTENASNRASFMRLETCNSVGTPSTAVYVDSSQRVGIGSNATAPDSTLYVRNTSSFDTQIKAVQTDSTGGVCAIRAQSSSALIDLMAGGGTYATNYMGADEAGLITQATGDSMRFNVGGSYCRWTFGSSEAARLTSSGQWLVGTSSSLSNALEGGVQIVGTSADAYLTLTRFGGATASAPAGIVLGRSRSGIKGTNTAVSDGDFLGVVEFTGADGGTNYRSAAQIAAYVDGAVSGGGAADMPGRLVFSTTADGASSPTERMRIQSTGTVLINKTSSSFTTSGFEYRSGNELLLTSTTTNISINRLSTDGDLIEFFQDTAKEGTISVSGSTVSYNGAHLSRWSQLPSGAERTEILRGSVLSNIDEMCEWGDEENEQLNRMKVSEIEGDKNVAGVFQAWDDDDDTYTNDFYCAMTGDFIIRIAQGVTVQRGDLLMSAGDGTAKPQDDDIIRSKTIAKVTSTNVSCTYDDGSYCVPCVLMAC